MKRGVSQTRTRVNFYEFKVRKPMMEDSTLSKDDSPMVRRTATQTSSGNINTQEILQSNTSTPRLNSSGSFYKRRQGKAFSFAVKSKAKAAQLSVKDSL